MKPEILFPHDVKFSFSFKELSVSRRDIMTGMTSFTFLVVNRIVLTYIRIRPRS